MDILENLFSPIVWAMQRIVECYIFLFSSVGAAILLTSFTFALLLLPVQKIANRVEQRISKKMAKVAAEIQQLDDKLKGEPRFLATEEIYQRNNYHPIQSIGLGTSFLVMLPILISAILLFNGDGMLTGEAFLFIDDLAKPDGLLAPINILPLLMFMITLVDAILRFKDDSSSRWRFFIISSVLLIIVYNLASGLILYWIGSNMMSLILNYRYSKPMVNLT